MLIGLSPAHLQPGQTVDGWRIVKPLGSGSFGAVYLVEKEGHRFALKMAMHRASSGDAEQTDARLLREMVCLSQVRGHANVVKVHAHGRWPHPSEGWLYVAVDYIEGYTLGEWVEKTHPTAHEVARVFGKLATALAHLHERGVFHRDLKLNNVLVRASDGEPFILDFSAGDYVLAPELTDTPLPPGTRRYRSPEAARFLHEHGDERDARYEFKATDDVYALGVCLYDVLTNPQPVSEPPRVLMGAPWPPPAPHAVNARVPDSLSAAAMHFIDRQPENRAPTAEVMRRELEALLSEEGEAWTVPLHVPRPQLPLASEAPHNDLPQEEAPTPTSMLSPRATRSGRCGRPGARCGLGGGLRRPASCLEGGEAQRARYGYYSGGRWPCRLPASYRAPHPHGVVPWGSVAPSCTCRERKPSRVARSRSDAPSRRVHLQEAEGPGLPPELASVSVGRVPQDVREYDRRCRALHGLPRCSSAPRAR
ncbi:serine/threonine protein kinase [Myxococcus stipitatus]|uniref:serine/threonine protein kinase n=1 Tax=Myxococcus stipitatus TaxID=83455 RepID=UPI001F26E3D5|nr:serine/threonine-protein kinase [Myxococcus stipitatus]MCE9669817.1 serine/threonine protein kinase [Myxococcus stipitatus]